MIALLLALQAQAVEGPLVPPLLDELERSAAELSLPGAPPLYHLRYKLLELDQVDAETAFGSLLRSHTDPYDALFVAVRVGEPAFDNTGFGGWQNGFLADGLGLEPTPTSLRNTAWRTTDRAYKEAVEQYSRKAAQFVAPPDYPGDWTLTGPVQDDLGTAEAAEAEPLVDLARGISAAMVQATPVTEEGPIALERAEVHVGHEAGSVTILDTEGTRLRTPVEETTLRALAHVRAADGMLLTDELLWTVRRPEHLPEPESMRDAAREMAADLVRLAEAPALQDEYVGPVLFEGEAALDLFRYLLVPQLEGTPDEVPFDSWFGEMGSQSGTSVRLNRRVLPLGWTVSDDPQRNPDHPGSFRYDAEGVAAEAVDVVTDGIVRDLLMSRVPRKEIEASNGHARGGLGDRARARAAQMEILPPKRMSERKLRKRAFRLASSYGNDWIVVVRRLQEPGIRALSTGYVDPEGPKLPAPVEVVRVFSNGREEPLRGAAFAGVQRFVLRDIMAAGEQVEGSYMASSAGEPWAYGPTEGLPTWLSAPEILIGELELVPSQPDPQEVPVVPPPDLSVRPAAVP